MSEENKIEPGFMITVSKQSMITGEVISVATNLPKGSTSEDIRQAIEDVTKAIDWRLPNVDVSGLLDPRSAESN